MTRPTREALLLAAETLDKLTRECRGAEPGSLSLSSAGCCEAMRREAVDLRARAAEAGDEPAHRDAAIAALLRQHAVDAGREVYGRHDGKPVVIKPPAPEPGKWECREEMAQRVWDAYHYSSETRTPAMQRALTAVIGPEIDQARAELAAALEAVAVVEAQKAELRAENERARGRHENCVRTSAATCVYLRDGTKVRIVRANGSTWLENVAQDAPRTEPAIAPAMEPGREAHEMWWWHRYQGRPAPWFALHEQERAAWAAVERALRGHEATLARTVDPGAPLSPIKREGGRAFVDEPEES